MIEELSKPKIDTLGLYKTKLTNKVKLNTEENEKTNYSPSKRISLKNHNTKDIKRDNEIKDNKIRNFQVCIINFNNRKLFISLKN